MVFIMMHFEFHTPDPYIFVGLSFLLRALSILKSLTLGGFVVKVEMSCSRAGLSNPALYAFQPHTPYLLLTASNWNCDHIFHTVRQTRSLLESTSLIQWSEFFSPLLFLALSQPSWYLSFPPSLCSPGLLAGFGDSSIADPVFWVLQPLSRSLSLSVDWTVHLLRLQEKKDRVDLRLV